MKGMRQSQRTTIGKNCSLPTAGWQQSAIKLTAISKYSLMHVLHHLFNWQSPINHLMEKNAVDGHFATAREAQRPCAMQVFCRFSTCSIGKVEDRVPGFALRSQ